MSEQTIAAIAADNVKNQKIVGLYGAIPASARQPDKDVIQLARDLLERAEAGDITGLAVVTVKPSGFGTEWAGKCERHVLMAGASLLNHRVLEAHEAAEE